MPAFPGTPGDDTLFGSLTEDVMEGFGGNDRLFGGADEDVLDGGDGNDLLDGGAHGDTMTGGLGDDYFYVENDGDDAVELADQGYDTVFVDGPLVDDHYNLPSNIERLIALNTAGPLSLGGNELANELIGNDSANVLYGGYGSGVVDILIGGGGDDTYALFSVYGPPVDVVIEYGNSGYDSVITGDHNYTLPDNVERLYGHNASLTGNDLDNYIEGGTPTEIIDGGAGADTMVGDYGNDYYVVENPGDLVVEGPNSGTPPYVGGYDTVFVAGIDYTLPAYVERSVAQDIAGVDAMDLTGNELANELTGNAGANVLDGKLGRDILTGNGGADTFAFTTALSASNADQLVGFEVGVDEIALDDAVFAGLTPGALAAGAFNTGSAATDADDRIIYDPAEGFLYFDADGSGAASNPILFAIVHEGLGVTASDFIVI